MPQSSRFVIMGAFMLFMLVQSAHAQSTEKFELGGQVSVLQLSVPTRTTLASLGACGASVCPASAIVHERDTQFGFGGRIGYNVNNYFAVEAELNFFPNAEAVSPQLEDGDNLQGLFGVKIGKRFEKAGIFAKARPGFLSESKGDLPELRAGIACIQIFPTPAGCFETARKTHLAFDIGGVVEVYPSKRTVIRFDAGDIIIRAGERRVPVVLSTHVGAVSIAAETTHNFQASIGFAFRF